MPFRYTDKFHNFGLFFCLVPNPGYESGGGAAGGSSPALRVSRPDVSRPASGGAQGGTVRKAGTFRKVS